MRSLDGRTCRRTTSAMNDAFLLLPADTNGTECPVCWQPPNVACSQHYVSEQSTRRPTHIESITCCSFLASTSGALNVPPTAGDAPFLSNTNTCIFYLSLNTLQVYILIFPRSLRPWLVLETFELLLHLLNSHELRVPAPPVNLNNNGSVELGMKLIVQDGQCIALGLITPLARRNSSTSQVPCFLSPGIILSSAAANRNARSGRGSVRGLVGTTRAQGPSNLAAIYTICQLASTTAKFGSILTSIVRSSRRSGPLDFVLKHAFAPHFTHHAVCACPDPWQNIAGSPFITVVVAFAVVAGRVIQALPAFGHGCRCILQRRGLLSWLKQGVTFQLSPDAAGL